MRRVLTSLDIPLFFLQINYYLYSSLSFYIHIHSYLYIDLGFGSGWAPAILNDQAEVDFIKEGQKEFCHDRSYWVGGSSIAAAWSVIHLS